MKISSLVFGVLVTFAGLCSSGAQTSYTLAPLGTPGVSSFTPTAINNLGQIVGYQAIEGGESAVVFQNGSLTTLPNATGYSFGRAYDINDFGQIVGDSYTGSGSVGFLYSNGSLTNVGNSRTARAINNAGQIVGTASNHGYLYSAGVMTDLGAFVGRPQENSSSALAINESGVIGGTSLSFGQYSPFVYKNGVMSPLQLAPNVPQGRGTFGGINDRGNIVGGSGNPVGSQLEAFALIDGQSINLNSLFVYPDASSVSYANTWADAINNSDVVVGMASVVRSGGGFNEYGFIYSLSDGLRLLDELFELSDGTVPGFTSLNSVVDINDLGQMIGTGMYFDGTSTFSAPFIVQTHTIPEPSVLFLLIVPLAAFLLRREAFSRNRF